MFQLNNDSEFLECSHNLEIPSGPLHYATGGILVRDGDWTPIVCGGKSFITNVVNDKCFTLSQAPHANQTAEEQSLDLMQINRIGAASLVVDNGKSLWVTGGGSPSSHNSVQTELVQLSHDDGHFVSSTSLQLPESLTHHCLKQIGPRMAIAVGGEDSDGYIHRNSWSLDLDSLEWRSQVLRAPRTKHACGVLINVELPTSKVVIAVGGETSTGTWTASVDLLVIVSFPEEEEEGEENEIPGEWIEGPKMPKIVHNAIGITTADHQRFLVVGVTDDSNLNVFEMQCSSGGMEVEVEWQCGWTAIEQKLPTLAAEGGLLPLHWPSVPMEPIGQISHHCDLYDKNRGKSSPPASVPVITGLQITS